jgi:hypothetical protein
MTFAKFPQGFTAEVAENAEKKEEEEKRHGLGARGPGFGSRVIALSLCTLCGEL